MAKSRIPSLEALETTRTVEISGIQLKLVRMQASLDDDTKKFDEVNSKHDKLGETVQHLSDQFVTLDEAQNQLEDMIIPDTKHNSRHKLSSLIKDTAKEEINLQLTQPHTVSIIAAEVLKDRTFTERIAGISGEKISKRVADLETYIQTHKNTDPGFRETFTTMSTDDAKYQART